MHNLSFSRFKQLTRLSARARREEAKEKLILAAFVGFQMGAGGDKTFPEYLVAQGLLDKLPERVDSQSKADDTEVLARMGIKVKKVKKQ